MSSFGSSGSSLAGREAPTERDPKLTAAADALRELNARLDDGSALALAYLLALPVLAAGLQGGRPAPAALRGFD